MNRWLIRRIVVSILICTSITGAAYAGSHRIGAGGQYWHAIKKIDVDKVDENGFAYILSYQYVPSVLVKLEIDLEVFPEDFLGASDPFYAPQALFIVGGFVYAGVGAGIFYSDGEWADDPFYVLRAGLSLNVLPHIYLDINANYHFTQFDSFKALGDDIDTDTLTLGAMVRVEL